MNKRRIFTFILTMIISASSCFSAYCAEVSGAEALSAGPAQAGIPAEEGSAGEISEDTSYAAVEDAEEARSVAPVEGTAEVPTDGAVEDAEEAASDASAENAEEELSDADVESTADVPADEVIEETGEELSDEAIEEAGEEQAAAAIEEAQGAEEDAEEEIILEEEPVEQAYTPEDTKSADELFAGYVDAEFGISEERPGKPLLFQKRRTSAGSRLGGDTLTAYNYVSAQLPLIASGEITSTHFTIPEEDVTFLTEIAWTAEDLGVSSIEQDGKISQEAKDAASIRLREEYFNLSLLIDALLADHPYLLYWYDKTPKTTADGYKYRAYKENGVWHLGYKGGLTLNFPVADEYAAGDYTVDASIGQAVQTSVENAQAVVADNEDLPDYEKLVAYRQEICSLTSYNYEAISDKMPYGNPWQLIWVFDGDPATEVVCEGYAKAFKYLCDRSSFEGEIDCKTVTGKINGVGHMWNLVTMEDEWNYLVDVTNCDSGTAGADDKLFLVGATGSPQEGYAADWGGLGRMYYTYDQDMLDLWSTEELTVSPYSYPPFIKNTVVEGIEDKIYTGGEITQEFTVMYCDRALSEGTDYAVSYENNTDVGTARMIIEGTGSYRGTIEEAFEIKKAPQPLSVSDDKVLTGRTAEVKISGAQGDVSTEISDPSVAELIVDEDTGTIRIRGVSAGVATLTVSAAETDNYEETEAVTQIFVVPGASTHVELTNVASGIKISWNEVAGARYYKVYRGEKYLFTTSRLYATDKEVKSDNGIKYTYRVFASTTKNSDSGDSTISRTGTGYRLIPVGITSLKNPAAGKMKVTYGKNAKSTGYVIRFGLKQDMSDAKVITVQGAGTLTRVLSGLKKGKTYYVQVRTYKLENGVRYYSGYCTTKSMKIIR